MSLSLIKLDLITAAFAEIGLAGYAADATADEITAAQTQLDRMVSMWSGRGIPIRFKTGGYDTAQSIECPDWAVEALVLNLAIRMAPSFGREAMMATKALAAQALEAVRTKSVNPQATPIDPQVVPAGAGNRFLGTFLSPYLKTEDNLIQIAPDLTLTQGT